MAKLIIILAVIATAYSAVVRNEDLLQRLERSPCYTCGHSPPPLSPPGFHTHNWSGMSRSADGLQNTIFSGAAAAANQGPAAVGEAFSLASSSAGAGLDRSINLGTAPDVNGAASSSHGAGFEKSAEASYAGSSDVKGGFGAGGYGGGYKVSGGGFKESQYSYHSGGNKNIDAHGESSQDGRSTALSGAQSGFSGDNKDEDFEGRHGEHFEDSANRGYGGIRETQNQFKGFAGHGKSEQFQGHGSFQQSNHQNGQVGDFTGGSSAHSSSYRPGRGGGHSEQGFISEGQRNEALSIDRNTGGHDYSHTGSGFSPGHQSEGNSFGTGGRRSNGFGSSTHEIGAEAGFSSNGGAAGHGHFESGSSVDGKGQLSQGSYVTRKQKGFEVSGSQSSSGAQEGLGGGQYHQISGKDLLQGSTLGTGFKQGDFGTESLGASGQGYLQGSGSSDAQSALSGALNLASQGLQTTGQAGCSTCGKNSYALSNAKSHSGSAVAVSIGG